MHAHTHTHTHTRRQDFSLSEVQKGTCHERIEGEDEGGRCAQKHTQSFDNEDLPPFVIARIWEMGQFRTVAGFVLTSGL